MRTGNRIEPTYNYKMVVKEEMKMKLKELLPVITHQNYKVFVQNSLTKVFEEPLRLETIDELKAHFDFKVIAIDEKWNITIRGE